MRTCRPACASARQSHGPKAVAALPRSKDLLDAAANAVERLIPGVKARQRFGFIPAPHGGNGETQGASPDTDGLTESLAPTSAVGEYLARVVRQSIGAGLAVIDIWPG